MRGTSQRPTPGGACVHTGYEPCHNTLHPKHTSLNFNNRPNGCHKQKHVNFAISPTYNMPQKCCAAGPEKSRRPTQPHPSTSHQQHVRKCCAAGPEKSRRPTQQARGSAKCCAAGLEKSRRPTQQALGLATSPDDMIFTDVMTFQHLRNHDFPTSTQAISTTFAMHAYIHFQLILVSTSTAQLIASQDIRSTQPRLQPTTSTHHKQ
jgi:hypothetical protein